VTEIDYKSVDAYIKNLQPDAAAGNQEAPAAVYLVFGEALLRDQVLEKLLKVLLPSSWNYEPLDGSEAEVHAAIEKVNTFSLLAGRKVVALNDVRLFDTGADVPALVQQAHKAYESRKLPQACGLLLRILALLQLKLEDTLEADWKSKLPVNDQDTAWLDEVAAFGRRHKKSVPEMDDAETALCRAVEKGFPAGNLLVITSESVDRRRKLYKTIRDRGVIIDCSVPKGERKAEKQAQEAVIRETLERTLANAGKQLEPGAFEALYSMTGFDLHTFVGNLEKLIDYVGERNLITAKDIHTALKRTRKDPVFALSNAVAERNLSDALFYTRSLMSDSENPLQPEQILAAIVNQVRKLLRIKDFLAGPHGGLWQPGCPYGQFRSVVMPAAVEFDRSLEQHVQQWDNADQAPQGGKSARRVKTDLFIVKNPKNPYPVYQQFLASDRFTFNALMEAMEHLADADLRIKSATEDKRKVLEAVLMRICL
jgi:DNA polymerase-3 subunit delta